VTGLSHNFENHKNPFKILFHFFYSIKSIFIALDRKVLAIKASRWAGQGKIVICDRYPTEVVGAMDSPRIQIAEGDSIFKNIFLLLAKWEQRIYSHIPTPDAVIRLKVPLEVAIKRNQIRKKKGEESELYVRNRHGMANKFYFPDSVVHCIDTNKPQKETVQEACKIIWDIL
jgi:thymidylate kinase